MSMITALFFLALDSCFLSSRDFFRHHLLDDIGRHRLNERSDTVAHLGAVIDPIPEPVEIEEVVLFIGPKRVVPTEFLHILPISGIADVGDYDAETLAAVRPLLSHSND